MPAKTLLRYQSQVRVTISDIEGALLTPAPLTRNLEVLAGEAAKPTRAGRAWKLMKPSAETWLEASRLALVLALAVFGLMGSARQQAQNLSFLEAVGPCSRSALEPTP